MEESWPWTIPLLDVIANDPVTTTATRVHVRHGAYNDSFGPVSFELEIPRKKDGASRDFDVSFTNGYITYVKAGFQEMYPTRSGIRKDEFALPVVFKDVCLKLQAASDLMLHGEMPANGDNILRERGGWSEDMPYARTLVQWVARERDLSFVEAVRLVSNSMMTTGLKALTVNIENFYNQFPLCAVEKHDDPDVDILHLARRKDVRDLSQGKVKDGASASDFLALSFHREKGLIAIKPENPNAPIRQEFSAIIKGKSELERLFAGA